MPSTDIRLLLQLLSSDMVAWQDILWEDSQPLSKVLWEPSPPDWLGICAGNTNYCHHGHRGKYAGKIQKKLRHMCTSDFERVYLESCLWVGKSWTKSNYYCVPLLQLTIANLCLSSQVKLKIESIVDKPPAARTWCACIFIELNDAANQRKISPRW